jgi:hypothetical protein
MPTILTWGFVLRSADGLMICQLRAWRVLEGPIGVTTLRVPYILAVILCWVQLFVAAG